MAQPMNAHKNNTCKCLGMLLALGFVVSPASAENLPDPTRPSGAVYADDNAAKTPSGPVLQSVLSSSGRKLAIISGQTVKQGDVIGNARVVRISDTEVTLAQEKETHVLKLFPVLTKQPSAAGSALKNGMRQ